MCFKHGIFHDFNGNYDDSICWSYSSCIFHDDIYEDIKEIPKAENISERRDVLDEYEEISKDKKEDTIDSMYGEKDE